jgi:hypothetical protein
MSFACIALFILFVCLQFSDAILTWRVIASGGSERNPVMVRLMRAIGMWPALVLVKGIVILLVCRYLPHDDPTWLFILDALYIAIVAHNWQQKTRGGAA